MNTKKYKSIVDKTYRMLRTGNYTARDVLIAAQMMGFGKQVMVGYRKEVLYFLETYYTSFPLYESVIYTRPKMSCDETAGTFKVDFREIGAYSPRQFLIVCRNIFMYTKGEVESFLENIGTSSSKEAATFSTKDAEKIQEEEDQPDTSSQELISLYLTPAELLHVTYVLDTLNNNLTMLGDYNGEDEVCEFYGDPYGGDCDSLDTLNKQVRKKVNTLVTANKLNGVESIAHLLLSPEDKKALARMDFDGNTPCVLADGTIQVGCVNVSVDELEHLHRISQKIRKQ